MKVKFKKLHPKAVIPTYAKEGDAGLDLTAISVEPLGSIMEYSTGLAVEIPEGYVGYIFPRSSIFKKELRLTNSVGVIDSGYRGEIKFYFDHKGYPESNYYKPGDRIGQLVIMPFPKIEPIESEELSSSERGTSGWGSSGA